MTETLTFDTVGDARVCNALFVLTPARWLAGSAYGVPHATLVGHIDFDPQGLAAFPAAYAWLRRFIGKDPRDLREDVSKSADMAAALVLSMSAIQRRTLIAQARILALHPSEGSDGSLGFHFATGFVYREAAMAVIAWLNDVGRTFGVPGGPMGPALSALEIRHAQLLDTLRAFGDRGRNRFSILQTAFENNIPASRLPGGQQLLGQGIRARLFNSSMTERTTAIGYQCAGNKQVTASILHRAGLPGAVHRAVASAAEAEAAAKRFGYPVVVKPSDRHGGLGVFADIRDASTLRHAFSESRKISRDILVERHFEGDGHRLTVVDGRVIRVTRKRPWGITGDGISTISALAEKARLEEPAGRAFDEEAQGLLRQGGLVPSSVLDDGRFVALRRRNNAVAGGDTTTLVIDSVHPDNLALACRAAAALRLDIAGVDLIIADIARSWIETGALICEVNVQPQMSGKLVEQMVMEQLQDEARIPVFLLIAPPGHDSGEANSVIPLARALHNAPFATSSGVWVGERKQRQASNAFAAARTLLEVPDVERALCVMNENDILTYGLPSDRFEHIYVSDEHPRQSLVNMLRAHAREGCLRLYRPDSRA